MTKIVKEVKSPYFKLTKDILVSKLEEAEQIISKNAKKVLDYDKMSNKYEILKGARAEDLKTIELANETVNSFKAKEQEIVLAFRQQLGDCQKSIMEQNQTILTLFEMMDNSINQQIFYYNKFKSIFVNMNGSQKEGKDPSE